MATLVEQIRAQGGDWNIGGIDRAQELADLLTRQGITSLSGMSLGGEYKDTRKFSRSAVEEGTQGGIANSRQLTIDGKTIGYAGDYNNDGSYGNKSGDALQQGDMIGWSARGDGGVGYNVITGADGQLKIAPNWGDTSDKDMAMRAAAGIAFLAAGPAMAAALGTGTGAAASAGAGAAGASGAAPALNMAAIESGLGTAGYGYNAGAAASGLFNPATIGAGAALGEIPGGLLDAGIKTLPGSLPGGAPPLEPLPMSGGPIAAPAALPAAAAIPGGAPAWLPEGLKSSWDFIKDNPKLIGAIGGGLLGGVTGSQEEEAPAPYTGPMPTITRGNWQASAASGYKPMAQQSYGGGLLSTGGTPQAASGMHRFMGLLGR